MKTLMGMMTGIWVMTRTEEGRKQLVDSYHSRVRQDLLTRNSVGCGKAQQLDSATLWCCFYRLVGP